MLPCNARLRFVMFGTLWLLGTASLSAAAERLASDEAVALRTAPPQQIDGDLSDAAWQTAARVENFIDPQSGGGSLGIGPHGQRHEQPKSQPGCCLRGHWISPRPKEGRTWSVSHPS